MNHRKALGRWGEACAAEYLIGRGYAVLARNVRTPHGEIDLIARQGEETVFVEVKTRATLRYGYPEEAVTAAKRTHLLAAAESYLAEHPEVQGAWRIDVIAIYRPTGHAEPQIEHFENAVS